MRGEVFPVWVGECVVWVGLNLNLQPRPAVITEEGPNPSRGGALTPNDQHSVSRIQVASPINYTIIT